MRTAFALFLVCALLSAAPAARADVIRLKNGNNLHGVVVREDSGKVTIRLAYGNITVKRDEILKIVRESPVAYTSRRAGESTSSGDCRKTTM